MRHINRIKYLEIAQKYRKTVPVILLTGLHGSGKSWLLASIIRTLRTEHPPVRIVQIGPQSEISNGRQLLGEARALGVGPSALCIDNADDIGELIPALAEIIRKYTVNVFITGRKTAELETALTSAFAGELGIIRIQPFSYAEFLEAHELADSRQTLELYARTGGLPESGMLPPDSEDIIPFLAMRANSFILTEIVERHSIRNPGHVRLLLESAARSTGTSLPARQVCLAFAKMRTTISPQAVLDYLSFCRGSGMLISVPTIDLSAKKNIEAGDAWFFGDTGLRTAFCSEPRAVDADRSVENLVLLHLIDEGWTVARGRIDTGGQNRETISFVCEKNDERVYIQMIGAEATAGEKIRRRAALLLIRDAWPKLFLDSGGDAAGNDGIRPVFVRDLLMNTLEAVLFQN